MYLLINDTIIKIKPCQTFISRLRGFMFVNTKIKNGLLFNHCKSIHTFFMTQPIDVVCCDKNDYVLYKYQALKPNSIVWPKKNVVKIYELPANASVNIELNSTLKFK